MAFDAIYRDGRDLTGRPLRDRRARLEDVVEGSERVFPVRRLATNGLEAWAQVLERGYEGLVAKDEASRYEPGPNEALAEGQAKGLDGSRGPLAAAAVPRAEAVKQFARSAFRHSPGTAQGRKRWSGQASDPIHSLQLMQGRAVGHLSSHLPDQENRQVSIPKRRDGAPPI
jgi:ATP dependent DNA ligase domain